MPRPAHTRVTFSGLYGSLIMPVEEWSFSLNASPKAFTNDAERTLAAEACVGAYEDFLQDRYRPSTRLTRVRVAQIGSDGVHVETDGEGAYRQSDAVVDVPGTSASAAIYPLQTALVVSLDTARSGPTGKGRIFLPAPAFPLQESTFLIDPDFIVDLAPRMASFIAAIDAALDIGQPVSSTKVAVASSYGYLSPVTGVRVGRALDTMRSRRRSLDEGYVSAPVNQ